MAEKENPISESVNISKTKLNTHTQAELDVHLTPLVVVLPSPKVLHGVSYSLTCGDAPLTLHPGAEQAPRCGLNGDVCEVSAGESFQFVVLVQFSVLEHVAEDSGGCPGCFQTPAAVIMGALDAHQFG